jgi:phosphatidylglycerol---prolipoprotein diacylglyceryl transferase
MGTVGSGDGSSRLTTLVGDHIMPRIYHDLDPFLWQITDTFGIRWYSMAYLLGFLLTRWYLGRATDRGEILNMTQDRLDTWILASFLGALLGARFFHVFVFEYSHYGFDPMRWIAVWRGGLAYHGGLVGVVLATYWFSRKYQVPFLQVADRAVIPIAIALGAGRIANFINAEMPGTLYDGPFCVDYSMNPHLARPPEGCRHPTQLYEMTKNWVLAGFLFLQLRRFRPRDGIVFWSFIGLYGAIRFSLMFLRDEERIFAGLTQSQIFSGSMALIAIIAITVLLRRPLSEPGRAKR